MDLQFAMSFELPDEVEQMISARCPPRDPIDAENFDPIEYLNRRVDENSRLSSLQALLEQAQKELSSTEQDLLLSVEGQANCSEMVLHAKSESTSGKAQIEESNDQPIHDGALIRFLFSTPQVIESLSTKVSSIKKKVELSEETMNSISGHIRKLDQAKKNITLSINTIRYLQLWMLQLEAAASSFNKENYIQCCDALKDAENYRLRLSHLVHLPRIQEMSETHEDMCRQLDSKTYFLFFPPVSTSDPPFDNVDENTLKEVCLIIDILGKKSRNRVRDHFIEYLLKPYYLRFKRGTEDAKIHRIERRYGFFRAIIERYSNFMTNVFPPHWCAPQELCLSFCLRSKEELDFHFNEAKGKIDVAVLTFALQKTVDIEKDMTQMMQWEEDFPGRNALPHYKYNGLILSAFKEHMGVFVENERSRLSELMAQPMIGEGQTELESWNSEGEVEIRMGTVLPLPQLVFVFIKESLKRSLLITQQEILADMALVWRTSLIKLSKDLGAMVPSTANSLKTVRQASVIANTAVLCRSTAQDLCSELQNRSGFPSRQLQFSSAIDNFTSLYSNAIQSILNGLSQMLSVQIQKYFTSITPTTPPSTSTLRLIISMLHDRFLLCTTVMATDVLQFLLHKIGAATISIFSRSFYASRFISGVVVKKVREDALILKKALAELPNYNDPLRFASSSLNVYGKLVSQCFEPLLCTLKIMEYPASSNMEAFTDLYYESLPPDDRSIAHFVKVVELMGAQREDATQWIKVLSKRGVIQETTRDTEQFLNK